MPSQTRYLRSSTASEPSLPSLRSVLRSDGEVGGCSWLSWVQSSRLPRGSASPGRQAGRRADSRREDRQTGRTGGQTGGQTGQTGRQADRQTDRQADRAGGQTGRQAGGQTDRAGGQTGRQGRRADRQTGRQADRRTGQAGRQADRQTGQAGRQADRQTGRQADRRTGGQTGRQADRQTGRHRQTGGPADPSAAGPITGAPGSEPNTAPAPPPPAASSTDPEPQQKQEPTRSRSGAGARPEHGSRAARPHVGPVPPGPPESTPDTGTIGAADTRVFLVQLIPRHGTGQRYRRVPGDSVFLTICQTVDRSAMGYQPVCLLPSYPFTCEFSRPYRPTPCNFSSSIQLRTRKRSSDPRERFLRRIRSSHVSVER